MKYFIRILFLGLVFAQNTFALDPFDSSPYLTPTSSPTNSVYINWNTETQESTIVAYGLTTLMEDTLRITGVRNYHHVELTGLISATEYFYQVVHWGNIKQFKTFPTPQADTFTFIAFGDTRSDSIAHQSVINRMVAYEFEFFIHTGDFVENGNTSSDWRTFFNIEDTLMQNKHILPTIGNHEFPYWPYDTLFALPDFEEYYSVNYGNAHFIMLNTEMDLYEAQRDWLIDDLTTTSSDTSINWIFVNIHRPPYSSGSGGSQMDVRNAWCPLFEQFDVDIVFAGHDHDYERTIPINGVVYIVTGGGGAPLYPVGSSSWTAYSEMTYHFCLINITGKKLIMKAIKPDGSVFDTVVVDSTTNVEEYKPSQIFTALEINPNPFSKKTDIRWQITDNSIVDLIIYDISGRLVKNFDQPKSPIIWSGVDNNGNKLPNGVYFIKLQGKDYSATEKLLLIK